MNISAVRSALATAAEAAAGDTGLTCLGYVPDSITAPVFYAGEVEIDYTTSTLGGTDVLDVTCRVLVGRADDQSSQRLLDAYLSGGAGGLRDAIEFDGTLGEVCHDVMVTRVRGYGTYDIGPDTYLGAELTVRVIGPAG
jgi:hypothetical protein